MKLTHHGEIRVTDRTKMVPKDVLAIIACGSFVSLGVDGDGYEFLLFYSPFDQESKIAVVAETRTVLISVGNENFALPPGVKTPSIKAKVRAYKLYRKFYFKHFISVEKIQSLYKIRIDVVLDQKTIYVHDTDIRLPTSYIDDQWPAIHVEVRKIGDIVEEHKSLIGSKSLRYQILRIDLTKGKFKLLKSIQHRHLKRLKIP